MMANKGYRVAIPKWPYVTMLEGSGLAVSWGFEGQRPGGDPKQASKASWSLRMVLRCQVTPSTMQKNMARSIGFHTILGKWSVENERKLVSSLVSRDGKLPGLPGSHPHRCRDRLRIAPWRCWQQPLRMPGRVKDGNRWDVGNLKNVRWIFNAAPKWNVWIIPSIVMISNVYIIKYNNL
jgi:hypothetical protein